MNSTSEVTIKLSKKNMWIANKIAKKWTNSLKNNKKGAEIYNFDPKLPKNYNNET